MPAGAEASELEREPEAALVSRASTGDEQAFASLVRPHMQKLHAVCYRIAGDNATAEDALQNALIAAWRNMARFEGRAKFSTWLYQIAHNAALAEVRRRPAAIPVDSFDIGVTAVARGPEDEVTTRSAVQHALARIPPDFRAALVLREFAGMSYQEIAEAQGIRVETVKTRISRGRQALARLLSQPDGQAS